MFRLLKNLPLLIGGSLLSYHAANLSLDAYNHFYFNPKDYLSVYGEGSYCVITKPCNDLGRSLADELATKGFNLILLEESEEALERLREEILAKHNVNVKTLQFNLASSSLEIYEQLKDSLRNYDVSLLVNNLVEGDELNFSGLDLHYIKNKIYANALAPSLIANILVPGLKGRNSKSTILNVTSNVISNDNQLNSSTLRESTNGLNEQLAQSLALELKNHVNIVNAHVGPLGSPSDNAGYIGKLFYSSEADVAREIVRKMELGHNDVYGTLRHGDYSYLYREVAGLYEMLPFSNKDKSAPQFG